MKTTMIGMLALLPFATSSFAQHRSSEVTRHPTVMSTLSTSSAPFVRSAALPQIDHVIIVEFENTDYKKAMAQPTFAAIVKAGANLSNFYAETHPSQPNYIAMIAGDTLGVKGDSNVNLNGRHIGDLLEDAGKTWKVYADGYPGNCFLGARSGQYARKHVPFLSFTNVQSSASRCANVVEGGEFANDLAADQLPNYALYIPDLDGDGHDTGVAYADNWLKSNFLPSLKNLPPNTLVVLTFDESSLFGGNHIYTAFYGDVVVPGSSFTAKTNHYGFLHTLEVLLGVGTLEKNDASSDVITGIWAK